MMKKIITACSLFIVLSASVAFATPVSWNKTSGVLEPLFTSRTDVVKVSTLSATSTTASSTFANGMNLSKGCFSLLGNCISLSNLTGTVPIANGGSGSTTAPVSQLLYGGTTSYQSVATTSATCAGTNSCSSFVVIGGTPIVITGNGALYPFTPATNFNANSNATTGVAWFQNGLQASSTSYISNASTTRLTTSGTAWILNASTTALSAYTAAFGATATSSFSSAGVLTLASALTVPNGGTGATTITGLVLGNGASAMTAYAGGSCTNQFLTALSAAGAFTCGSVNLANGTQVTGTLPIGNGGTGSTTVQSGRVMYGGATSYQSVATGTVSAGTGITISATIYALLNAASIAVDQAANFAWTGVHDFGAAVIEITNGSAPTVDAIGEMALDTTDNQLLVATSTNASYPAVIRTVQPLYRFRISSTSAPFFSGFSSGKLIGLPSDIDGFTAVSITCSVWGGTSIVINLTDQANNDTQTITCGTATSTQGLSTNNVFTALESANIETGTVTGVPDQLFIAVFGSVTRE